MQARKPQDVFQRIGYTKSPPTLLTCIFALSFFNLDAVARNFVLLSEPGRFAASSTDVRSIDLIFSLSSSHLAAIACCIVLLSELRQFAAAFTNVRWIDLVKVTALTKVFVGLLQALPARE